MTAYTFTTHHDAVEFARGAMKDTNMVLGAPTHDDRIVIISRTDHYDDTVTLIDDYNDAPDTLNEILASWGCHADDISAIRFVDTTVNLTVFAGSDFVPENNQADISVLGWCEIKNAHIALDNEQFEIQI